MYILSLSSSTESKIDLKSEYFERNKNGFLISSEIKLSLNAGRLLSLLSPFFGYRFQYGKDQPSYPTVDLADGIPVEIISYEEDKEEAMKQYRWMEKRKISVSPHCSGGSGCLWENLGESWYRLPYSKYTEKGDINISAILVASDRSKPYDYSHTGAEGLIKELGYQNACFDDLLIFAASGVMNDFEIGREDAQLSQKGWSEDYRVFGLGERTKLSTSCCGGGTFYPAFLGYTNSTPKRVVTFKEYPEGGTYLGIKLN